MRLLAIGCFVLLVAACAPTPADLDADPSPGSVATPTEEQTDDDHENDEADHDEADHHDEDEYERRELGAHEHGAAELTVAMAGSEMAVDLQTPAFNVLGFEYAPASEEEKARLAESVTALEAGELFQIDAAAGCTLVEADVNSELLRDEHGAEEHGDGEVHSDMSAAYIFACEEADEIRALDASALFTQFPNFEAIQVQWVSETQQSAATLTAEEPIVSFR